MIQKAERWEIVCDNSNCGIVVRIPPDNQRLFECVKDAEDAAKYVKLADGRHYCGALCAVEMTIESMKKEKA